MRRRPTATTRANAKRQAESSAPSGRRAAARPPSRRGAGAPRPRALAIEVVWSQIASVDADVLLAGHYMDVLPQGAELALDRLVSGASGSSGKLVITELTRRGALRGDVGEIIFFPAPKGRSVAVAGMGRLGTFRASQVRLLALTVGQVIGLLPDHATLATVLIGSGKGNLKVAEALVPFVEGLAEALDSDATLQLRRVLFVESRLDRALEILKTVKEMATRYNDERVARGRTVLEAPRTLINGQGGEISPDFGCAMVLAALARASESPPSTELAGALDAVLAELPAELHDVVRKRLRAGRAGGKAAAISELAMSFRLRDPDDDDAGGDSSSRVAFWQSDKDIRAAAITNSSTVVERDIPRRAGLVEQASENLQIASAERVEEFAGKLCRFVVPYELKDTLKRPEPLVIEVDRSLARVQWEMLPAGARGEPLGVARSVARQLRTLYSPRPFDPRTREQLRALVIGDPGPAEFALPVAREEAQEVADALNASGVETTLLLGPPEDGTGAGEVQDVPPAHYFEVVDLLLSGKFDIVHFSGHATFDAATANKTGWIFKGRDQEISVLTAGELTNMECAPRLVVANACLSSQISQPTSAREGQGASASSAPRRDSRLVASLADEFFKQGVSDYIGVAWEIPSDPAKRFVAEFYRTLLSRANGRPTTLGAALLHARRELYRERERLGPAWGAYQHYGDPTRPILPPT